MPYTDVNTPVIEQIELPSGSKYYIADRQIRNVVQSLSDTVAGGVSYIITWDGTSTPVVAEIPAGVVVKYNNTEYTGTFNANNATPGAFYLVKSSTAPSDQPKDIYDEYIPIGAAGSKTWEKIGDTSLNLTDVVKNVTLDKKTASVIGASSTFKITQPTIALATDATSGTGKVQVVTGISAANANLTGIGSTNVVGSISVNSSNSAITEVTPSTTTLTKSTLRGVTGTTTTASKHTALASQTTATGAGTASDDNTDWLKGVSVTSGVLSLGAATMNTQTTTQYSFSDVTVPVQNSSATNILTASANVSVVTGVETEDANFVSSVTPSNVSVLNADGTPGVSITPTTTYIKATASGAKTEWNSKNAQTALINTTDVVVTTN